jgi:hypothetical protein
MKSFISSIIFIAYLSSCGSQIKPIDKFDNAAWKSDKSGCNGIRANSYKSIIEQKKNFLNHTQEEVKAYLGMPDKNELMERGQKQFIYFFKNGEGCANNEGNIEAIYLRFGAMNNLYEVSIQ